MPTILTPTNPLSMPARADMPDHPPPNGGGWQGAKEPAVDAVDIQSAHGQPSTRLDIFDAFDQAPIFGVIEHYQIAGAAGPQDVRGRGGIGALRRPEIARFFGIMKSL